MNTVEAQSNTIARLRNELEEAKKNDNRDPETGRYVPSNNNP